MSLMTAVNLFFFFIIEHGLLIRFCVILCWLCVCCALRLIWLLIILFASGFMVYLIAVKLNYLLSNPKSVNVDFNFNASLPFPAVTICNESPYR